MDRAGPADEESTLLEAIRVRVGSRALATAESCTAGRVAAALAGANNAADFFRGGLVAYQVPVKQQLLDVSSSHVLNLQTAEEMARGVCRLLSAEVAVTTTGLAGGKPIDDVPVGTVFIGTAVDGVVRATRHCFTGDPEEVCAAASRQALRDLLDALGPDAAGDRFGRGPGWVPRRS